jgi:hypothetical protein
MKFDSPLFDRIRVKPGQDRTVRPDATAAACNYPGCKLKATHRAPKGRNQEQEYWHFCLEHVRAYNHSYNFFSGMSDDAVTRYQKDALTGHRPTWKMGTGKQPDAGSTQGRGPFGGAADPFGVFHGFGSGRARASAKPEAETRVVRNAERKALDTLGLEIDATLQDIKARFKALVKRHHPDANGGDRSTEERLREIIQAYKYLKSVATR